MAGSSTFADLRDRFSSSDQTWGNAHFKNGRVVDLIEFDGLVEAQVRGSGNRYHHVELELAPSGAGVLSYTCSCPRFDRAGCCEHVWAVLQKLESDQASTGANSGNGSSNGRKGATANSGPNRQTTLVPAGSVPDQSKPAGSRPPVVVGSVVPSGQAGGRSPEIRAVLGLDHPDFPPPWKSMLQLIRQQVSWIQSGQLTRKSDRNTSTTLYYLLEVSIQGHQWPSIRIHMHDRLASERPWHETPAATHRELDGFEPSLAPPDSRIINSLLDANPDEDDDNDNYSYRRSWTHFPRYKPASISNFQIDDDCPSFLLREIVETGRLFWRIDSTTQPEPLKIEFYAQQPLQPQLVLSDENSHRIRLSLQILAGETAFPIEDVVWLWESGAVLLPSLLGEIDRVYRPWLAHFLNNGDQLIAAEQRDGLIQSLLEIPQAPPLVWPDSWNLRSEVGVPEPVLKLKWPAKLPRDLSEFTLPANPTFRYGGQYLPLGDTITTQILDSDHSRILSRDFPKEQLQLTDLLATGKLISNDKCRSAVEFTALPTLTETLAQIGWTVEAEGRPLVAPGKFSLEVTSELDWFDLSGGVTYADQIVPLPVLLQAVRRKENFVRLDDGSHGMLPTEWIDKFGKFLELADEEGESLRFGRAQALLLDSLLAEQEQTDLVTLDPGFNNFRKQLAGFRGIKPGNEPRGFRGELREYQRDGLGWFGFLQSFGFGGCLADDMGLGKTIQVLALLEQRRVRRLKKDEVRKPSLVVVPKSLVFNWIEEAAKFAPRLKVVNFTGVDRGDRADQLATADVVLTTYGTLRNEIQRLVELEFDYAILDEAQAIKNPKTDAAKSCYLIRAAHRLTMTGTPIENHLGDLWSQFRFLNPGLLGHSQAFAAFSRSDCEPETLQQLSNAIRPFILRRTKQEVLQDLPDKTEQTLYCEMSPKQTRQYNELRQHYRVKLGKTVQELGMKRSKIHVLEALLRLRQAACDGRLVNPKQGARGSKLDLLLEQLDEVLEEGHKVLVFSQFTSLLALLEKDLKKRKLSYEYLDGKTSDRRSRVQRFQNDDDCQLFLISLKAGGYGLNLTAADYVYILDPWWNPAAESQAIDRAHRMGQTKNVFAYRMITKGTVEEKILELQKSKRELADSIISGNNSLIRTLTADDLQLLLG